jgi:BlaI family penicillinase repressor
MRLTDSEWKIANCLWDKSPMTIAEITQELKESTEWTKYTVITLLKRMEEKGAVTYVQEGRTKYFSPAIDKAEAENEEVSTLLDKVYNGNAGLLISNLVGSDRLTEEQIEELRRMFTED